MESISSSILNFLSAAGGSGGAIQPPQPPVSQGMEFVLEGNAKDKFDEMIATGNDANNIYVKVNEDTSYQKINDLIKSKMVTVSPDGRYQFDKSVTKVSLYVKYDANYMVQFMPNVAGIGFSENAPLVLDGSGSQHIQIDKRSTRSHGRMTMCVMAKMLIWSMEQQKLLQ